MNLICVGCRSASIKGECEVCGSAVCGKCRVFLSSDEFPFAEERPEGLRHTYYCGACHDREVEPFKVAYEETLERAKGINVLFKDSKSVARVVRKAQQAIVIKDVRDRDEVVMRLAFRAAQQDFNALVDVEVSSQKVRNEGWEKQSWSGRGVPAQIVLPKQ